ncbi:MAG: division/cell wall cluster transcriptional repressor MraZ [Gammaproteobacteria bacterium]
MFRGIHLVLLDAKSRMAIPAKYRTQLENLSQNRLVVTIDTDEPCLLLYPLNEWELIEQQIIGLPSFHKASRRIQRLLIGHATDLELDNNARILIPALLREYAGIDKNVMLIGQGKKFEIWSEANWQANRQDWLTDTSLKEELSPPLQTLSL